MKGRDRIIESLSDAELVQAAAIGWQIDERFASGRRQRAVVANHVAVEPTLVEIFAAVIAANLKTTERARRAFTPEQRRRQREYQSAYYRARPWIRKRYDRNGRRRDQGVNQEGRAA